MSVASAEACEDSPSRICEGSGLRLALQILGGGMPSLDDLLPSQNGYFYLFVDGDCRYWAFDSYPLGAQSTASGTYPARSGVLSEGQEQELAEALSYSAWENRVEYSLAVQDAPTVYLWRPGCVMRLDSWPYSETRPPFEGSLGARLETAMTWANELYESGEDVDGPMRLWAIDTGPNGDPLDAPLESLPFDPANYAVSWDDADNVIARDPAPLVTEPDALEWLRAQWLITATGKYQGQLPAAGLLPVRSDGVDYLVTYRNAIPLEDDDGFIRAK